MFVLTELPRALKEAKFLPEAEVLQNAAALLPETTSPFWQEVQALAQTLLNAMRSYKEETNLQDLVGRFSLTSPEGMAMLGLAEALLRTQHTGTSDALIEDKLKGVDVSKILQGQTDLSARFVRTGLKLGQSALASSLAGIARPLLRRGVKTGVAQLGSVFVLAPTIEQALKRAAPSATQYYSFDMLGEGARTHEDAERYFNNYAHAIQRLNGTEGLGISVKLSALYPRYDAAQIEEALKALSEKMVQLCRLAKEAKCELTIDAEEVERLHPSLSLLKDLISHPDLQGWQGLGLAVQAYQKRALPVIAWLDELSHPLHVRLVKGAYWDTEIRRAQLAGLENYPLFTRKAHTDVHYLACAERLLQAKNLTPHFATHNALTAAAVIKLAEQHGVKTLKFQRLHGMGAGLAHALQTAGHTVTVYAPVGGTADLLAYLVRRLLENGANTSFLAQAQQGDDAKLLQNPLTVLVETEGAPHPKIPLPHDLYSDRVNSAGLDVREATTRHETLNTLQNMPPLPSAPALNTPPNIEQLFETARNTLSLEQRANLLEAWANALHDSRLLLFQALVVEAKKTLPDAEAELREAIDFCRYYATQARVNLAPQKLTGPTGESNTLLCVPRGTFVCISPWNFPLAIFVGQIAAAFVAGNAVIAKPAEQTPYIAQLAIDLLHTTGCPKPAVQLVFGDGTTGAALVAHEKVSGVAFTGSTAAAKSIHRSLAAKNGPIVPLIAETGGLNAMIVDDTALPEQVVDDVVASAFLSAGQRCSCLRLLCLPESLAEKVIPMLQGAMQTLTLGNTVLPNVDIGGIIDQEAFDRLKTHETWLQQNATILHKVPDAGGTLFGPLLAELNHVDALTEEFFGPILHVVRYAPETRNALMQRINAKGFGLTFGVQSRISATQRALAEQAQVGNVYINRNIVGAVVGVQPFGGSGLSGTGPKAGGPHYLYAFVTEKHVSIDLTAAGGNTALLSL